ncbi:2Fe-2S iron-sulfur cluster binding domain-containing protein [Sinorhizobium medicae]|uniref:Putative adenylate/guanylate cyclase n=4 Tax=Sinorhizobium medicae TaxID=110321 RepID=A6UC16_SINMW|nr:adenylate/guanylate cyclase domain-containing protein [Sinorhizobium medicae]ABR61196.1 putative adenylate/guanylate cyclase [Sinorhizobium medicae WSM419]MBO1943432.1 adenylate/guanylate cyclase domain-containing protein [Sinorhizobium medicae]MBO1959103.1 adenylate/guanylate cyclase domain-containing protein [Sinorhizobium medicae]MDX0411205.1 2Fe-2S iron-sulfur cluster binding domain-containing protein [Sinorhizobium medicae]MDX0428179.1 2Fe-2S iron-sulfur cluster binding domain-containi
MTILSASTRKKMHLISGAVLGIFVLCHFSNHALGLVSIGAMEVGRRIFTSVWHSVPGTVVLYGALLLHFLMALDSLYRRQTFRMPAGEALKIVFGLSLPFLLVPHVVATRVEPLLTGIYPDYAGILRTLWSSSINASRQSLALIVVWGHACLGAWFWMRGRAWFPRYETLLYTVALLVPIFALLGFVNGARSLERDYAEHGGYGDRAYAGASQERADPAVLESIRLAFYGGFAALIGATLALRAMPARGRIRIRYPDGRVAAVSLGFSVLEASRAAGIPHVSVCGGRGRCSTCRVRITQGLENQPAPEAAELATLTRIGAPENIRLACQFRPVHNVSVVPILNTDSIGVKTQIARQNAGGRERRVAVLFCDLRDFTRIAEHRLPYDTVFLLNRYFEVVGEAVEGSGGVIDKFIGDGALAIFGLKTPLPEACRQALSAAARLSQGIRALNQTFEGELDQPLRLAIGLHAGPAIIGEMGYGQATSLTAVGDTINTASRLEGLAKEHDAELAVSAELVQRAGLAFEGHRRLEISLRGRQATLETWIVGDASQLSLSLPSPS